MKRKLMILVCCLSAVSPMVSLAQTQDNTAVCHAPNPTKASAKPAQLMEGYGKAHLGITTKSAEAQKFFDQGLALLHSFWYYEADRSFERAAQLDGDCAMAQWGIAMAAVNDKRRDEAVKRAKELSAKVSEREQLYIKAVEARYQGERNNVQNNPALGSGEAYRNALRKIVGSYPDDLEAKLFLALASMSGYERDGSPRPGTVEAITLCQLVLAKEPNHLAAHHYMIHATEAGKRPQDGVPAADVYGKLAPKVGHAVHMPGHIYVHVDRWEDAAKAFEASAEVDRNWMRDNHEPSDHAAGPYGHNINFLVMVYAYQGRYRDGLRVSQDLLELSRQKGEEQSRAGLEARLAMLRMLVRFEKWDEILGGKSLPDAGPYEVFNAWHHYARGLAHLGKWDTAAARADLNALERENAWLKERFAKSKELLQGGRQRAQLRALAVAPLELKARILAAEGKADEAVTLLREGIEEEIKLGYSEPPLYPQPMEEVAGKIALTLKRWKDAEEFFRAALERDPGSGRAFFGLMRAQQGGGNDAAARDTYAKFMKAWAKADSDLPEMQRAKALAATAQQPLNGKRQQ
jgi:tetratricopeptide (TPR) repeat protein